MSRYGYARASSPDQDLEIQIGQLEEAGCSVIRTGIAAAQARGAYRGRRRPIDVQAVHDLMSQGLGASHIAKHLKISRSSVYRALSRTSQPPTTDRAG